MEDILAARVEHERLQVRVLRFNDFGFWGPKWKGSLFFASAYLHELSLAELDEHGPLVPTIVQRNAGTLEVIQLESRRWNGALCVALSAVIASCARLVHLAIDTKMIAKTQLASLERDDDFLHPRAPLL